VLEGEVFTLTEAGTPQGGVISPLLADIALHGMENECSKGIRSQEKPFLVRYADDFLIFHSDKEVLIQVAHRITDWLTNMGLYVNPNKTNVTHTLTPTEGRVGFDFLGFTVRQFQVGKTHTGKDPQGKPLGFKTIIKPSKEAIKRHTLEIKRQIRELRSRSQAQLIKTLNPIIRGWTNYYRTVVASRTFSTCDHILHWQLRRWSKSRHPRKGRQWIDRKYWRTKERRQWAFATAEGAEIRRHSMTNIQRHTKVKGIASPYDGNLLYWSKRLKDHPLTDGRLGKLLQRQQGKCKWCNLLFKDGDLIEIDHYQPKSQGGSDRLDNLFALHRHCHDQRHAKDAADRYA
jgi:RNA-directed DNA polymerase